MDVLARMATYVRIVEAGSLSAAARQLRLSAAAVSRQLAALEDEVGAPLIARTTRRMTVTAHGQQYYERSSASCATSTTRRRSLAPRGRAVR